MLRAADQRLTEVRKGIPDAGGLVIATDQDSARAYAKLIREITGQQGRPSCSPTTPAPRKRIEEFSATRRPLDGRGPDGVRGRRRAAARGRRVRHHHLDAAVLRPGRRPFRAVPAARRDRVGLRADHPDAAGASPTRWRSSATTSSTSRRRQGEEDPFAEEDKLLAEAEQAEDEDTEDGQLPFEALESDAVFDRVLYDGAEFGMQAHPGSEEEQDYLGIPGLLEPDQVQMLLQKRQARQIAHSRKKPDAEADLLETARRAAAGGHPQGAAGAAQAAQHAWWRPTSTRAASRTA